MLTDLGNELGMAEYIPGVDDDRSTGDGVDPPKKYDFEDSTPVAEAILPAVVVDTDSGSFRDCFIDDVIDCHLGTKRNLRRGSDRQLPQLHRALVELAITDPQTGGNILQVKKLLRHRCHNQSHRHLQTRQPLQGLSSLLVQWMAKLGSLQAE
ncbi:MAG: hypothetical protein ACKO21_08865 [Nodosilinea sp.]